MRGNCLERWYANAVGAGATKAVLLRSRDENGHSASAGAPKPSGRATRARTAKRVLAAIRDAAIAEFSQNGLKGTSTQAIAERAGLTKPQLHYYIKARKNCTRSS
jgi:hypothetical protein